MVSLFNYTTLIVCKESNKTKKISFAFLSFAFLIHLMIVEEDKPLFLFQTFTNSYDL